MASEGAKPGFERHIAMHRARRANIFSARGSFLCAENLMVGVLALAAGLIWLVQTAMPAADPARRPTLPLPAGQLSVVMLDIHQGDSIFVQTPDLKRILIDAGPAPTDRDSFSAGRDKILPFLREHGIERLDAVVISHAHLDHIGGLAHLLNTIPVDRVYDPGFDFASPEYEKVLDIIERSSGAIEWRVPQPGDTLDFGTQVLAQVLAPPRPYVTNTRSDCNSNSLVLRLVYGQMAFLFTGDSEEETEHVLTDYGDGLRSTFLKVAHHGSRYASQEHFLELVRPRYALISAGRNNTFGHPHKETLERLEKVGAQVRRTDLDGDILVLTDGQRFKVVTGRPRG